MNWTSGAIWRSDNAGLAYRLVLLSLIMLTSYIVAAAVPDWFGFDLDRQQLTVVFLMVFLSMAVSLVLSEIPRGNDWIMARLGLATFCRTGLPIFFWGVITLSSKKQLSTSALGFMVFFYMIGIKASVWISVCRFANSEDALEKNEEVDRAPE